MHPNPNVCAGSYRQPTPRNQKQNNREYTHEIHSSQHSRPRDDGEHGTGGRKISQIVFGGGVALAAVSFLAGLGFTGAMV